VTVFTVVVQFSGHVHNQWRNNFTPFVAKCQHVFQFNCFNTVVFSQLEVMVVQKFSQLSSKMFTTTYQVSNTYCATRHFVFVCRTDTTTCRTNLRITTFFLTRLVKCDVVRKNQWTVWRNA